MTLLSPFSLVWLATGAAILALYLLKPRSRRVEVSSTWLWQGALKQESARSLIQWLKRHILLLLQLLVALLGVFALARPAFSRELPVGRTIVFAMDVSAPMLANDGDPAALAAAGINPAAANSVTRLDEARARALVALGQLRPGDRAVILRAADRAEVAAEGALPAERGALQSAIQRLQAVPAELDVTQALEVAGALTRTARVGQIVLYTGGVADVGVLAHQPPVLTQVIQVGRGNADNQAITTLSARRSGAGDVQVFVRVRNFGDQPASGPLRFIVDGQTLEEQQITVPARDEWHGIVSEFPPDTKVIEARFGRADELALDNVATAAVPVAPLRKVLLVGARSDQLERALKAVPGVELTKADPQKYSPKGGYDIYVFEGWFPPTPPPGHWVLIDPPAKGAGVSVTGTLGRRTESSGYEVNDAQIARILPSPLLQGVDLTGVGVTEAKRVQLPDWAEEVVSAREAPLIFMGYPRPYRAVVFAFDLRASNLFGRVAFPVLIANTVNWLTGDLASAGDLSSAAASGQFVPGDALMIQPLPRATRVQIETPSKKSYQFTGNQPVRFLDTGLPGAYTVTQFAGNDAISKRVYVASVLRPGRESAVSDLRPRPEMQQIATAPGTQQFPIVLGPGHEQLQSEWWRVLGVLALAGLLVEWWWFHR